MDLLWLPRSERGEVLVRSHVGMFSIRNLGANESLLKSGNIFAQQAN